MNAAALAVAAGLSMAACHHHAAGQGRAQPAATDTCPEDIVVEKLHDAVFFLEHRRDDARVARDLKEIRRLVSPESPGAAMALDFANRIGTLEARPGAVEPESETIRAELHASACLTSEAHRRFHRALRSE